MKILSSKQVILSSILIFTIGGLGYALLAPKIYSSKSHIALFRIKIENPDSSSEETRNRWIWIRDGLNLKSAIITDELVEKIIQIDPTAKSISEKLKNKPLTNEHIKKFVNIQFTGADENNFLVEVKAPSAELAYNLNSLVFDRIKYLAIEADQKKFNDLIIELKKMQEKLKSKPQANAFYEDKIKKLIFNNIIEQKQRSDAFEVISNPVLNEHPIWPNRKLIILLSAIIGLVIGNAINILFKMGLREK